MTQLDNFRLIGHDKLSYDKFMHYIQGKEPERALSLQVPRIRACVLACPPVCTVILAPPRRGAGFDGPYAVSMTLDVTVNV
jgi:hypothetical protein